MDKHMTKKLKIQIRLTVLEKEKILEKCKKYNFTSISEYIRVISLSGELKINDN